MEINNKYITIPNIIFADREITINSKYLYGWIQFEIYNGQFNKSIDDICEVLQCSVNTARKCLKELEKKNYIKVEIQNMNKRIITPLISDSMTLEYLSKKLQIDKMKELEKIAEERKKETYKKETPQYVKDFMDSIK